MKLKLLYSLLTTLLSSTAATFGALSVSFSFSPTLQSGLDPQDLANATWSFTYNSSQTNYGNFGGFPGIVTDSAELTITGSVSVDGTYAIMDATTNNFLLIPDTGLANTASVGINTNVSESEFSFSGVTVEFFGPTGTQVAIPAVNDPVSPSDFNGISLANDGQFRVTVGGDSGEFTFTNATTSAIPEPGTYVLIAGLTSLFLAFYIRRKQ
ncbi:PEP-CTERM sorting domain-containing protein [Rubellicoccus peritrichatus]|uniref:Ice-binding protein C-terminal domain-containing protein n=1 Tax=Rubellicoccus peritrichatus TaxID=3080537 RepID=A0AAQ3L9E7_9BACT|nr:PEP-CTERM sorting domain-containing protein [Puniceicoccus sp. CR14]WOO41082.1 hypothetical protein RZN69_20880 [Puniceicoccus sp. CR14]